MKTARQVGLGLVLACIQPGCRPGLADLDYKQDRCFFANQLGIAAIFSVVNFCRLRLARKPTPPTELTGPLSEK